MGKGRRAGGSLSGSRVEAPLQGNLARMDAREGAPRLALPGAVSLPVQGLSHGGISRAPWRGPCTSAQGAGSVDMFPHGEPPACASEREHAEGPASQVTVLLSPPGRILRCRRVLLF